MSVRKRTWEIVDLARRDDKWSRAVDLGMLLLILFNVIAVVVGSVQSIQVRFTSYLNAFEFVSVFIFTLEYVIRLWSCTADPRYHHAVRGRIRFALEPMSVVDLVSVLPFYLPFVGVDLRSLRVLRLLRILRIVRVGRYYSSLKLIRHVIQSKKEELILTSALMGILLVLSATLLYYCENEAQPTQFSSIPASMWWAVSALTTVGYGDIYPVTTLGKSCASIMSILGIGMFALPTGILGAGFVEAIQKAKAPRRHCPHCGKEIDP